MDLHHINADPDPAFHFDADLDLDPDPDPAPHQINAHLQPLQISILSLQTSIESVHGSPLLHFEPLNLLNFDFNADSNPANADPDQDLASKIDADPCGSGTLVTCIKNWNANL
jgi:hypothetical protein